VDRIDILEDRQALMGPFGFKSHVLGVDRIDTETQVSSDLVAFFQGSARASGNAASKMLLIDGSEAKLQGLLQCLSASALLSLGIAFNLYHPTADCKPVCLPLSRSLMQTSEQQQISGVHKEKDTWGPKVSWLFSPTRSEITSLDSGNIDDILNNADVALVNFYADWCRFSQMLHPIFEEASNVIKEEYPDKNQVVFARVDCDQHSDIAQRYRISKYPTLKLFRNGMMMKREYRGQRSVTAIADYIRQQKSNPIREVQDLEEISSLDRSRRNIVGYFEQKDSDNYRTFERVANILHDDCVFLSAFG
ncbi:PREDICTED: endoplasmic reticulum resident protein 44-like, partial [Eurypyga helias]|uniref:endoplasmic reticulum resident protein 44-like n=1 Tax=Eurypyga helias TaxID=54383 RepID=UPI0005295AE5